MNELRMPKDRHSLLVEKKCMDCGEKMKIHRAKKNCPVCGGINTLRSVYSGRVVE